MIKLYQFPSCWGLPNVSPFCLKLETYLRMVNLPYQTISVMDPRKAPKGKLPYIEDQNVLFTDSSLIIAYLKNKYGDALDVKLTALQKAKAVFIQRMMDDHLYWCILYSRWIDEVNWQQTKHDLFLSLPAIPRYFIAAFVQRAMRSNLHAHGLGRHSAAEIYQMGIDDLVALHTILDDHPFLLGNEPSTIDASGYAFLANLIKTPTRSTMHDYAKSKPKFIEYCDRMKSLYFASA